MSIMSDLGTYLKDKNKQVIDSLVSASGYTTKVKSKDRFLETNTPNVLVDKVGDDYVIDGVLYSQLGDKLVTTGVQTAISNTTTLVYGNTSLFSVGQGIVLINESTKQEVLRTTIVAISTNSFIQFADTYDREAVAYSVRELKQATKPLAPFDPNAGDELLDDKVNGLVCQQAHSKGDIVVTGNELVTNGTFDSDVSGWTASSSTISTDTTVFTDGGLKITNTTGFGRVYQAIDTVVGLEYYVSLDYSLDTATRNVIGIGNTEVDAINGVIASNIMTEASGVNFVNFTASATTTYVAIGIDSGATTIQYIDNISVKLADSVYQATRDTSEMYDYEAEVGVETQLAPNNVYKIVGTAFTNWNDGDFVQYKGTTTSLWTPNSGSLSPSNPSIYLGTAENMDLRNPYFQVLEDVTRHDVIAMSSSGYKTYKGLKHYYDTEIIDGSHDLIASDRGWQKIGNNTYLDEDGDKVFIVGLIPTLNAGAYHPIFNGFGTKAFINDSNYESRFTWYGTNSKPLNIYDTIIKATQTTASNGEGTGTVEAIAGELAYTGTVWSSTRPDSKFYDKFYIEAENGLLGLGYAYCFDDIDLAIDKNRLKDYIQSGTLAEQTLQVTTGTVDTIEVQDGSEWVKFSYIQVYDITASALKGRFKILDIVGNTLTIDTSISKSANEYLICGKKSKTHLTGGTKLSVDMIGDPANYPSWLKTSLASGRGIHINPLLVGQDGTSYVNQGIIDVTLSDKFLCDLGAGSVPYSDDNGISWATTSNSSVSFITNSRPSTQTTDRLYLLNYTSVNEPVQTVPKEVLKVLDKVIASNSHSIYKDNLIANAISGGVATGNGSNSYESKILENWLNYGIQKYDYKASVDGDSTISVVSNVTIVFNDLSDDFGVTPKGIKGGLYLRVGSSTSFVFNSTNLGNTDNWKLVGYISTPKHTPIELDNSDSKAGKWFYALSIKDKQYYIDIYGKELIWDFGLDNTSEFTSVNKGTNTSFIKGNFYNITGAPTAIAVECIQDVTLTFDALHQEDGYWASSNGTKYFKDWDGNGFTDNNKFDDLSKCLSIPTGIFKK